VTGGLLLTAGLSASPAGATVTPTAETVPAAVAATNPTCGIGIHNTYEYYTNCTSSTKTYYRTVAECGDGNIALGAEYLDGSRSVSISNCKNDSGLNAFDNWGYIWCSSNSGTGTLDGVWNTSNNISQFLVTVGGGNQTTGGTYMCDYDANASVSIPDTPS
jgi:hypothetical protein